ncbi:MAG: Rrf2 family transcriptional regulator [Planctomycetes bacterium]|nr:Rrf2 family transcriptional regulator [Planctomycetota bacterium]
MLSTTAEYALRIMVVLSDKSDAPMTSERVATMAGVPGDYAVKVLQMLARARFVRAQRGRGGGFRLMCDAENTSLLDVVDAIDPIQRLATCPLGREPEHGGLCALHRSLDEALAQLQRSLSRTTFAEVAETRTLCPVKTAVNAVPAIRAE